MMVASELETMARLRLPITVIVFNDAALSLIEVKQEQKGYAGAVHALRGARSGRAGQVLRRRGESGRHRRGRASRARCRGAGRAGPHLIDARIDPSGYRTMLEIVRGSPAVSRYTRAHGISLARRTSRRSAKEFEKLDGPGDS